MTQVFLLYCRICTLKVSWDLHFKKPCEHRFPPTEVLSTTLPRSLTPWSCSYVSGSIKVFLASLRGQVAFLSNPANHEHHNSTWRGRKRGGRGISLSAQRCYSLLTWHGPESATAIQIPLGKGPISTQSAVQFCHCYFCAIPTKRCLWCITK